MNAPPGGRSCGDSPGSDDTLYVPAGLAHDPPGRQETPMTRSGIPVLRKFCLAGAAALTAAMAGCWTMGYSPGGRQASLDEFTYESTADHPYSLYLIDLRTRETIWSMDVPVGKEVVIK